MKKTKRSTSFLTYYSLAFVNHIFYNPTRIVDNATPSLIDNIFANSIDHSPISGNLTCKVSDHLPNFIILLFKILTKILNKSKLKKETINILMKNRF